jgi:mannose-6-phosphate isomerase
LHTKEALEAIDFGLVDKYKTDYRPVENGTASVVNCPQFTTNLVQFNQMLKKNLELMDSFVIYIGVEGRCELKWDNQSIPLGIGEAVLVPAIFDHLILKPLSGQVKLLEVYLI